MRKITLITLALVLSTQICLANQPSPLQIFYSIKKILPEAKKVGVFIPEETFKNDETKIARASKQMGMEVKVYLIKDTKSIGKNMKKLKDVDILVVYDDPVLVNKSSMMFVLSKCKDKKIPIISSSEDYSNAGALIFLGRDDNKKIYYVLNLKHTEYLAAKFDDASVEKLGIAKLIR